MRPYVSWSLYANCRGFSSLDWTPEFEDTPLTSEQELICGMCKVKDDCFKYAIENDADGIWGGTNSYQRRIMQVPRNRAKCPGCGSHDVTDLGSEQICMSCGVSWTKLT